MNTDSAEAGALIDGLKALVADVDNVDIAICPPHVYLHQAVYLTRDSNVQVGAQNCHFESKGAFTGEIAPEMLKDVGCTYVILGHSERRHIFGETDDIINGKAKKALAVKLSVILCVGELLDEREAGQTEMVVETQLAGCLKDLSNDDLSNMTIAYEPVWAIGTGKTATPDQAQEVHAFIRNWLQEKFGMDVAGNMRIQYGGSVKPENAQDLPFSHPFRPRGLCQRRLSSHPLKQHQTGRAGLPGELPGKRLRIDAETCQQGLGDMPLKRRADVPFSVWFALPRAVAGVSHCLQPSLERQYAPEHEPRRTDPAGLRCGEANHRPVQHHRRSRGRLVNRRDEEQTEDT